MMDLTKEELEEAMQIMKMDKAQAHNDHGQIEALSGFVWETDAGEKNLERFKKWRWIKKYRTPFKP